MIKLPINGQWSQPNNSDKFGSLWATKNVNLDEEGYIKLSPRMVTAVSETTSTDFGLPVAIGRYQAGKFQIATSSDANFVGDFTANAIDFGFDIDTGTAEPTLTVDSHAIFWQGRWYASTTDGIFYKDGTGTDNATWTTTGASLTSGKPHFLEVFRSRTQLCVTNGNEVKQYNTGHSTTQDLTLPSDFTATHLAYNDDVMAVGTKTVTSSFAPSQNAFLFIWDGTTASASAGYDTGAVEIVALTAYKSSFLLLTSTGQLLYFNGGGFDSIASFPYYFEDKLLGGIDQQLHFGDTMAVDGDVVYINMANYLSPFGRKEERIMPNAQSGVWCYDPRVGLYHRWSPSRSTVGAINVTSIDTGTNEFTVANGTNPATGDIVRYVDTTVTAAGGIKIGSDYYAIATGASTFQLAETREQALAGDAIDITSAGSGTQIFWSFNIIDFASTYHSRAGAVAAFGNTTSRYTDVLCGADLPNTAGVDKETLCFAVPFLENRGWIITPKIFATNAEDTIQKLFIRYRPLKTGDAIIVKARFENADGVPVTAQTITWTGTNEFYTTADLSEAKTYFDAGNALECEITSGAGAGTMSQVSEINYDSGTYSLVLSDDIIGVSSGNVGSCILDNWTVYKTIDEDGAGEVPIANASKWAQFKIELRGDRTTIEQVDIIDSSHKSNN